MYKQKAGAMNRLTPGRKRRVPICYDLNIDSRWPANSGGVYFPDRNSPNSGSNSERCVGDITEGIHLLAGVFDARVSASHASLPIFVSSTSRLRAGTAKPVRST